MHFTFNHPIFALSLHTHTHTHSHKRTHTHIHSHIHTHTDVIERPICLRDVKNKVEAGDYSKYMQHTKFAQDMRLIWRNCKLYNLYRSQIWYVHVFVYVFVYVNLYVYTLARPFFFLLPLSLSLSFYVTCSYLIFIPPLLLLYLVLY